MIRRYEEGAFTNRKTLCANLYEGGEVGYHFPGRREPGTIMIQKKGNNPQWKGHQNSLKKEGKGGRRNSYPGAINQRQANQSQKRGNHISARPCQKKKGKMFKKKPAWGGFFLRGQAFVELEGERGRTIEIRGR